MDIFLIPCGECLVPNQKTKSRFIVQQKLFIPKTFEFKAFKAVFPQNEVKENKSNTHSWGHFQVSRYSTTSNSSKQKEIDV